MPFEWLKAVSVKKDVHTKTFVMHLPKVTPSIFDFHGLTVHSLLSLSPKAREMTYDEFELPIVSEAYLRVDRSRPYLV